MALNWDDSLLLGNEEIDRAHQQIFDYFEKLSIACMECRGEEVLHEVLQYLDDYASQHFSDEEALMEEHNYPKLPEQQIQHAYFRHSVQSLREMDMQHMDSNELSQLIYRKLVLWFNQHIKQSDQQMLNYFRAQQYY